LIATVQIRSKKLKIDLSKPLDLSIPITGKTNNVNAWYVAPPKIAAQVVDGQSISIKDGATVNFNQITFSPHAHGTHTENVGHILSGNYDINKTLKQYFFLAEVITVAPEKYEDDYVISRKQLQFALGNKKREAVVIRTLPNTRDKFTKQYSHTNPTYLMEDAAEYLRKKGVQHLLVDLPSIDKEEDEGTLASHNAFWNTAGRVRVSATITEFIYVSNKIKDGCYVLNLQTAPIENDASPSRPILYEAINE